MPGATIPASAHPRRARRHGRRQEDTFEVGRDRRGSGGARGSGARASRTRRAQVARASRARRGRFAKGEGPSGASESPPHGPTRPSELPPLAASRSRELPPVGRVALAPAKILVAPWERARVGAWRRAAASGKR
eukprot:scaffold74676_cov58-Phaeocystis_antarctica.AAC.1